MQLNKRPIYFGREVRKERKKLKAQSTATAYSFNRKWLIFTKQPFNGNKAWNLTNQMRLLSLDCYLAAQECTKFDL
jgi:hypothetical protein